MVGRKQGSLMTNPGELKHCYCIKLGPVARCNVCWNDLVEGKNQLVRENNQLREELLKPKEGDK